MPKEQSPVELGNGLGLETYRSTYLPEVSTGITFESSGLDSKYLITLESSSSISTLDLRSCFELLTLTTSADYVASQMGWHPKKKMKEMRLPDMRYLLVRRSSSSPPEAFASFMLTYEDGREVIYLYEIHLQEHLRGTGLGKKLMALVENAGRLAKMSMSMLTVFRANRNAREFYISRGYNVDAYSPVAKVLRSGATKDPDYEILSKRL